MDESRILIRVSEGTKVEGYELVQVGIDKKGRYKEIRTPEGKIKKVYTYNYKPDDFFPRIVITEYTAIAAKMIK